MRWELPPSGSFKCNADASVRERTGFSFVAFCVRDCHGDLIYAEAKSIPNTTCLKAESLAIQEGLDFFVRNKIFPLIWRLN